MHNSNVDDGSLNSLLLHEESDTEHETQGLTSSLGSAHLRWPIENSRSKRDHSPFRQAPPSPGGTTQPGAPKQWPTRGRRLAAWISLDRSGMRSFIHADKRSIVQKLGLNIPQRDMRLLDSLKAPSEHGQILVRDRSIVFSFEYVRMIVTSDAAIIPREGSEINPAAARFVDILEEAVADWARQLVRANEESVEPATSGPVPVPPSAFATTQQHQYTASNKNPSLFDGDDTASGSALTRVGEPYLLPFELMVMETALKEVVALYARQVSELEGVALPALDALTKNISSNTLERVRKVKTRHQRLALKVGYIREELEEYLEDDDDMGKMCLTQKKELEEAWKQAQQSNSMEERPDSPQTFVGRYGSLRNAIGSPFLAARANSLLMHPPNLNRDSAVAMNTIHHHLQPEQQVQEEYPAGIDIDEVENLLDYYFVQVDGLQDKLTSMDEYIKDTEEYINIELDSSRNKLIRLEIILTAATFSIAPFNLLAGILGENLVIPRQLTESVQRFYVLNAMAFMTCFAVFYLILVYMRYKKLI